MKTAKKIILGIIGCAVCVVIGAGVAHGISYKDKIIDAWNNTFHKNDQNQEEKNDTKTDETVSTASITILSDGTTRLNK